MQEINIVRKKWLIWFFIFIALNVLLLLVSTIQWIDVYCLFKRTDLIFGAIRTFLIELLFAVFIFFVGYYFAYKKKGTKLLLFMIVFFPLVRIKYLIDDFIMMKAVGWNLKFQLLTIGPNILFVGVLVFFIINCFRLYKINKKAIVK